MTKAYTAITEASGGSDPARAIQLKAVRDGDSYVLNGSKMWISHAPDADWGVVYARTGEGRNGISAFILEKDTPGVTFSRIPVMASFSPMNCTSTTCGYRPNRWSARKVRASLWRATSWCTAASSMPQALSASRSQPST